METLSRDVLLIPICRGLYYGSYYNSNSWFPRILIFIVLMDIAFIRYVLHWGTEFPGGDTLITNLLSPFPCLIGWVTGCLYIPIPTLNILCISVYITFRNIRVYNYSFLLYTFSF